MNPLVKETWPSAPHSFFLAIQLISSEPCQFHAAMLYLNNNELMIGDLQNHMTTRKAIAKPNDKIYWIAPDLSQEDQKILASKLDAWLTLNPNRIPYSVAHPGGIIFENDIWIGNEPGQGLTCATFVTELFNELAIPFIDKETWESRPGDKEWAKRVLELIGNNMSVEHKKVQIDLIGETVRIRPSDVFAAGILLTQETDTPLSFQTVSPRAESVENCLICKES